MTDEKNQFNDLKPKCGGDVTFEDNSNGQIEGIGFIGNNSYTNIKNVLLVRYLKHIFLNISQLCDKGLKVIFESMGCKVIDVKTNKLIFIGYRQENIYVVYLDDLSSKMCVSWLKMKMSVGCGVKDLDMLACM